MSQTVSVVPADVLACRRCSKCKEIQGLSEFRNNNTSSWCRTCANEHAKKYRRTKRYREITRIWLEKPGVREARREASRRCKSRKKWWQTPAGKLRNQRSLARYRLRRYEAVGNEAAAQRQRARIAEITAEIDRVTTNEKESNNHPQTRLGTNRAAVLSGVRRLGQ